MPDSEEVVFAQEPALCRETLILRGDCVVVVHQIAGERRERHIQMADIAEEIEMTERRFPRFLGPQLFFFVIFAGAAWKVSGPSWISDVLSLLFGCLALSCVFATYVVIQPIAVARVKNKRGDVLFELYRHKNVALPFEEFLLQLQRRHRRLTGG